MRQKQFKTLNQCTNYARETRITWTRGGQANAVFHGLKWPEKVWGNPSVSSLDRRAVKRLIKEMVNAGCANSYVNKVVGYVRTALNECMNDGLVEYNINWEGLRLPEGERQPLVYTFEEVDQMARSARVDFDRHDLADIVIAYAWTGARRAELLKLAKKDIDWQRGLVLIGGRRDNENKPKKAVQIPIMKPLENILRPRCEDMPNDALIFGDDWRTVGTLRYWFEKVRDYSLEKRYSLMHLRHTFCTALLDMDYPLDVVSDIMCHSSMEVTRRYARANNKRKRNALNKLESSYMDGTLQQDPLEHLNGNSWRNLEKPVGERVH